jgi:hypothetical protein
VTYPRNPNGLGGFQPGHPPLSNGRPRSESAIRLLFLRDCRDAHATIVGIMHNAAGTKAEALRLQAADMILSRAIGKPGQQVSLEMTLNKPLESMSEQELREFRTRYAAIVAASPKLLDEVIDGEERAEPELPLFGDGHDAGEGDDAGDSGPPAAGTVRRVHLSMRST